MAKPLRAGGEVDSWCTKCKLVLNHRIIALVGTTPARVECSTCSSHHNFRARAPGDKAPSAGGTTRSSASTSSGPRSTRGPTKAQQIVLDRERSWEKLAVIVGFVVAVIAAWRRAPLIVVVVLAAAATALVRAM